ncbi:MAG: response regulator transcription factor [Pseudomonadota bacterium]
MPKQFAKKKPRILIVEDDQVLNEQIAGLIQGMGYDVDQCFDGEKGLAAAAKMQHALIILDVMLPGRDGLSLLSILRKSSSKPVIIVSARHAEEERIRGLSAGADDYLAKPFNVEELKLRIDAVLRRTRVTEPEDRDQQELDGLTIDRRRQEVRAHGQLVELTPTQQSLLWTLLRNKDEVLPKPYLYAAVLDRSYSSYDRSLDMHLSRVRRKLNEAGWTGSRLKTVHGKGYCLR